MYKENRKKKDIEIRRNEILDAVERIYDQGNFDKVTMDDIASEAQFTKQTLYAYFKGKEEIMASIYIRAANWINQKIKDKMEENRELSGYDRLDLMRIVFTEIAVKKPFYTKMMSIYQLKDLSEFRDLGIYDEIITKNQNLTNYMTDCIERGMADGSIAKGRDVQAGVQFLKAITLGGIATAVYNKEYIEEVLGLKPEESLNDILAFSMNAFKSAAE